MTAPQIGPAFARVLAALDGRTVVGAGIRRAVSCPGPGHWRGDVHPSLTIEAADGKGCCTATPGATWMTCWALSG